MGVANTLSGIGFPPQLPCYEKFLGILKTLFSKRVLSGGQGQSPSFSRSPINPNLKLFDLCHIPAIGSLPQKQNRAIELPMAL
jgi:hypothetical protein